jgi:excisionase family DNA binding protein
MLLTITQTAALLGVHRTTIHRWMLKPDFPKAIRMSAKIVRFNEAEVDAWLASRGGAV